MKLSCFTVLAVILLVGADKPRDPQVSREMDQLAGMWKLSRTEYSDGSVEVGRDLCLVIEPNGTVRFIVADEDTTRTEVVDYQFDPTPTPKHYLVATEGDGKKLTKLGIYALEGDTLKFCSLADSSKRPNQFTVEKDHGGGDTLWIYKRRK